MESFEEGKDAVAIFRHDFHLVGISETTILTPDVSSFFDWI